MAVYLIMFTVILLSLFCFSSQHQHVNDDHDHLIGELQEANLKIAQLESVLEEIVETIDAKSRLSEERDKFIEDMQNQIQYLQSSLYSTKGDSSRIDERINTLREEVKLLWASLRKNNFDTHILQAKTQDANDRLKVVISEVEKMADIVAEQWIQIQQLVQMREFNARRHKTTTRCTFLKFINSFYEVYIQKFLGVLDSYTLGKKNTLSSYISRGLQQLKALWSAVKKYHYELQGFVKDKMERNEFTASFANEEVVFFVASALITFPILWVWMLLSSQFS